MGLDMYLTKRTYVGFNFEHRRGEGGAVPLMTTGSIEHIKPERVSQIDEQVGYWRKANAIHAWFVKNVQGGMDECQESEVSREQLEQLLRDVNDVLEHIQTCKGKVVSGHRAGPDTDGKLVPMVEDGDIVLNPEVAVEKLPTQSGFFFGSQDYDEYYVEYLKETKEILDEVLQEQVPSDAMVSFIYQASW